MLDAKHLQALAAVAEHGSFSAAARALALTVAAVSLRVKALEAQLGQRLLVRGKALRTTVAGQTLLAHAKQVRLMEADLLQRLGGDAEQRWQSVPLAINADSAAVWLLPGVAPLLQRQRLLLDLSIDDQDHTHELLKNGSVVGCVSTRADAMRGCVAEPLGVMRYRCVATAALAARVRSPRGRITPHRLLGLPAVIFNRKDALQDLWLERHFGLRQARYPRHFMPAVDAFERAIELGLGWGMVPELHLAQRQHGPELVELLPGATVDVALYWQHWAQEPPTVQRLSRAIRDSARACLETDTIPATMPA